MMKVFVAISLVTKEEDFVEIGSYTGSMDIPHLPAIGSTIGVWWCGSFISFGVTSISMIKDSEGWIDKVGLRLERGPSVPDLSGMFSEFGFIKRN